MPWNTSSSYHNRTNDTIDLPLYHVINRLDYIGNTIDHEYDLGYSHAYNSSYMANVTIDLSL